MTYMTYPYPFPWLPGSPSQSWDYEIITTTGTGAFASDFRLEGDRYQLELPLAGYKKTDVQVEYDPKDRVVRVVATKGSKSLSSTHYLPESFDESTFSASMEDGLLVIEVGVQQPKSTKIAVK